MVIEVSRKFLPSMAASFNDPRVTKYVGDGIAFMKEHKNLYDVIITDSSDPQGNSRALHDVIKIFDHQDQQKISLKNLTINL